MGDDTGQERLRALAEAQYAAIEDREVLGCWHVVVEAITQRWLTPGSLDELIGVLVDGGGVGVEEYGMEVVGDDRVEVALVGDRFTCSRTAMTAELRRLAAAFRGESPGPDVSQATAVLHALAGLAATHDDTPAGRRAREEASARLAEWTAQDPAADDIRQAAAGLSPGQRTELAAGLRAFADWAESPGTASGRRVDAVIAGLERGLGPLLEHGRRAEQAATDARIAASVQESIARRLREAGADGG